MINKTAFVALSHDGLTACTSLRKRLSGDLVTTASTNTPTRSNHPARIVRTVRSITGLRPISATTANIKTNRGMTNRAMSAHAVIIGRQINDN